jgi:hypothetical protein
LLSKLYIFKDADTFGKWGIVYEDEIS